ncbi:hypothetical protein Pth03_44340 [Planotetraspora thailandica]|uniref:Ester cyclase n=1 Tax=Planotetraspora thailandica TaxID=487172 RepID=A0A8J3XXE8_9ACTN|nr:ester cyclase [Planotetraspora thailandica]GII56045.1 hypothetical protein Pth03_44340 [Planotetraspora thailandica]
MTQIDQSAKQVVHAFYDSYNRKDLKTSFDSHISTDLVNHAMGGAYDRSAWLEIDSTLFPAFEDFTLTVLDQVAEGNKVATRISMGGRQTGEFVGLPAGGKTAFLTLTAVDRVENGLIVEHWVDLDFSSFLEKLR